MSNTLENFIKEAPEVQKAYQGFIGSLIELEGLDAKTKQLIYIAMKIVSDDLNAVRMHVPMAKNLGASREEVVSVAMLAISVIGLKSVSTFLPVIIECYEK